MKEIIEQIKNIKGVKTVEPLDNKVMVTFKPEKYAVHCTNKEQYKFAFYSQTERPPFYAFNTECYANIGSYDTVSLRGFFSGVQDVKWFREKGYTILNFYEYIKQYNLEDKWDDFMLEEAKKRYPVGTNYRSAGTERRYVVGSQDFRANHQYRKVFAQEGCGVLWASGKWAEIIEEEIELVDGEIYCSYCECFGTTIFRRGFTTFSLTHRTFYNLEADHIIDYKRVKLATKKQKKKLIKAEVKNGYFHELR